MNGALHANINAVLAHIRNGNLNGPVGLLAGLAIADTKAAEDQNRASDLAELAEAYDELNAGLEELGFDSLADYLAAAEAGELTDEEIARVTDLVEAAGGLTDDGTSLAVKPPTDEEIMAAEKAASESGQAVSDAEQAILDSWNKDGDEQALLAALRDRLAGYEDEISAAIKTASADEEEAKAAPDPEAGAATASN